MINDTFIPFDIFCKFENLKEKNEKDKIKKIVKEVLWEKEKEKNSRIS